MEETGLVQAELLGAAANAREEILRPANTALEQVLAAYRVPASTVPAPSATEPPAVKPAARYRWLSYVVGIVGTFIIFSLAVYYWGGLPWWGRVLLVIGAIGTTGLVIGIAVAIYVSATPTTPSSPGAGVTREQRIAAATDQWRTQVRDQGVLPLYRRLINVRLQPLLWRLIQITEAPGLDRLRDIQYVVETLSLQRFLRAMRQLPASAVGIAGPRGVGKTTLIEYYAAQQQRWYTVSVSAPVRYEPRDFMLHLYAELCRAVLRRTGSPTEYGTRRSRPLYRRVRRYLIALAVAVLAAGVAASPVIGWHTAWHSPDAILTRPSWWLIPCYALLALALLALGVLVRAGWQLTAVRRAVADRRAGLGGVAEQRLHQIRFLQTRTTGWSGTLALPAGLTGGWSKSAQQAEQALTYPEIVGELREFLGRVTKSGQVLVAIDELDKIEDAELAQKFLNEIKGIFGVDNVQFLVAVSDDALASFERRGQPIRDAFDSSFDEIIRIEHLTLADTTRLVNSRVIGVPEPFLALIHCMSGGLAREVIRTTRTIVAASKDSRRPIDEICRDLVGEDVERKVHAFQLAVGKLAGVSETTEFIRALRGLHADPAVLRAALPELWATGKPDADQDFEALRWQASTYVYHCATLVEVFTGRLDKELLDAKLTLLDTLAAAKRELGSHPQLAWLMVDEFRAAWPLPSLEQQRAQAG